MGYPIVRKIADQKGRGASSWSLREAVWVRVWAAVWLLLARWTPKQMNFWRIFLLRVFGAKIFGHPFVFSSTKIYAPFNLTLEDRACLGPCSTIYNLGHVFCRERCVVSQEAYVCGGTHDLNDPNLPLMIGDIEIGRDVFMGARSFILPGISVGEGAVVGACAVVTKDVAPWTVVVGNPARVIKKREIKMPK